MDGDELKKRLQQFADDIKEKIEEERLKNSITAHYGMKDEDYDKIVVELLCDMLRTNTKNEVLDKHFPELSAEGRLRVLAYSNATMKIIKLQGD